MSTIEDIISRRSIKSYEEDRFPPRETMDKILKAATYSPTGMGKQSPIMICVYNKETCNLLSKLNAQVLGSPIDPFYKAPVVVAVLADTNRPTYLYDGSLVMANLMLAAHSEGIGSCWIHRAKEVFKLEEGKQLLKEWGVADHYEGIAFCIMGYQKNEPKVQADRKEDYIRIIN